MGPWPGLEPGPAGPQPTVLTATLSQPYVNVGSSPVYEQLCIEDAIDQRVEALWFSWRKYEELGKVHLNGVHNAHFHPNS